MKIVVFSQRFFPEIATINEVTSLLVKRGHEVTVMTGLPNAPAGKIFRGYGPFKKLKEKWSGVDIRRNWLIPKGDGSNKRLVMTYLSYVISASTMLPRLRGIKPDIIFVNQLTPITKAIPAILYKKIVGAPLVMWVHDLWPESVTSSGAIKNKYAIDAIGKMVNYIYRNCDLVLAQSKAMNTKIEERGVPPSNISFLPNPIDTLFKPIENTPPPSALNNLPSESFIIMFAGNIGRSQDLPTIISAAKILQKHSDIHWIIIGDGSKKQEAEKISKSYGLTDNIHFLGSHPIETMPKFYAAADVMLVTLLNEEIYSLTVPLKTQGYLACAKPIICNVPGEATRIIDEARAGFTIPPEEPRALADAALKAYKERGEYLDKKGHNAHLYFKKHYTQEKIMNTLEGHLKKLS